MAWKIAWLSRRRCWSSQRRYSLSGCASRARLASTSRALSVRSARCCSAPKSRAGAWRSSSWPDGRRAASIRCWTLERAGWVTSSWDDDAERRGPRRRMYRLTPEGAAEARRVVARAAPAPRWVPRTAQ
ncbi:helix-turn-helix transcriptional regulator [Lentzea tibetensis]|uniref:helix-turn-helix transcriptional regulator n=1 Tax=Lentzea tibetensis TaxID=2591470 RepID=UPI0038B3AE87